LPWSLSSRCETAYATMSILDVNLPQHPCYAKTSEGFEYLEFSCIARVPQLYTEYVLFFAKGKNNRSPFFSRFIPSSSEYSSKIIIIHHSYYINYTPSFERHYDGADVFVWMEEHPLVPIAACVLYLAAIQFGTLHFQTRDRWNWRWLMAGWNGLLSAFSTIGFLRTFPQLLYNLTTYDLANMICLEPRSTYGSGSTGLWVQLFVLSKFPELLDTFFIVIHKKPLIFLHWYHHVTVLLYCWHSYVTKSGSGIFFVVMNYFVHAIMYGYYGLMTLKCCPKWFKPIFITALQISQMVVGVAVTVVGFYLYHTWSNETRTCSITADNNTAAFVMYGSYLFLFLQFFFARYTPTVTTTKQKKVL
jgi:elongation of very long chain fatty acids protein 6